jgi:hypothetical protein
VVRAAGPRTPDAPEADTIAAYRECYRQYLSHGITSVHVAGTSPGSARLMEKARTAELPLRFYFLFREANLEEAARRWRESGSNPDDIRFGAFKLLHGNSLSAQTCWLSKPYANRPDYFGVPPARSQAGLNQLILSVHEAGLQACVHSNGDREIGMVLTAFEHALAQQPRANHRHLIEHGSVVTDELSQCSNRRFAMVAEPILCLIQQLRFILDASGLMPPSHLRQYFLPCPPTHAFVHSGQGHSDFWRNESFYPSSRPLTGNKTFGSDRILKFRHFFVALAWRA